jgi:hypothetical protein
MTFHKFPSLASAIPKLFCSYFKILQPDDPQFASYGQIKNIFLYIMFVTLCYFMLLCYTKLRQCYVILCYVMLMLCYANAMLCSVVLCCLVVLRYVILYYINFCVTAGAFTSKKK